MKKLYALSLIFCIYPFIANAQWSLGVSAGINKNYLTTSTGYRNFLKYEPTEGFNIGVPVRYKFNNWFSLKAEPQYITKGYKYERSGYYEGIYQSFKNNYLQLPVVGQFYYGTKKLKGYLNLGFYMAYWTSGKTKGHVPNFFGDYLINNAEVKEGTIFMDQPGAKFDESYVFDSRRDRRVDLGLTAGIGLNYSINKKYAVFIEGNYYRAMLDMEKIYMEQQTPKYNDTFALQIGFFYSFK